MDIITDQGRLLCCIRAWRPCALTIVAHGYKPSLQRVFKSWGTGPGMKFYKDGTSEDIDSLVTPATLGPSTPRRDQLG